ncbi:hypothetical protein COCMIDRAFT_1595 [Bipolaris oryzae ATCC 44560]|uniref:Uncharacterized protein n=1 Tax=Bipolaris oryzae ATCC 44560 TaxID=930090 RepID=W6ZID3_COCMI|nr:uncharacterized protein COCMIDRAFT_1595 [Bipolaris oryzae ATCC 44560]EUC49765.1 hypothetical protein COCMIDRAFT_1595 [Bipolaris oryzae ATCC 44560]
MAITPQDYCFKFLTRPLAEFLLNSKHVSPYDGIPYGDCFSRVLALWLLDTRLYSGR